MMVVTQLSGTSSWKRRRGTPLYTHTPRKHHANTCSLFAPLPLLTPFCSPKVPHHRPLPASLPSPRAQAGPSSATSECTWTWTSARTVSIRSAHRTIAQPHCTIKPLHHRTSTTPCITSVTLRGAAWTSWGPCRPCASPAPPVTPPGACTTGGLPIARANTRH